MDLQGMVNEVMKQKAVLFVQWLDKTYNGDIDGLNFEQQYNFFDKWYAAEQARQALSGTHKEI